MKTFTIWFYCKCQPITQTQITYFYTAKIYFFPLFYFSCSLQMSMGPFSASKCVTVARLFSLIGAISVRQLVWDRWSGFHNSTALKMQLGLDMQSLNRAFTHRSIYSSLRSSEVLLLVWPQPSSSHKEATTSPPLTILHIQYMISFKDQPFHFPRGEMCHFWTCIGIKRTWNKIDRQIDITVFDSFLVFKRWETRHHDSTIHVFLFCIPSTSFSNYQESLRLQQW